MWYASRLVRLTTTFAGLLVVAATAACGGLPVTGSFLSDANSRSSMDFSEALLHSFDSTDGAWNTYAGLVFDTAGNLYGTTQFGGNSTCGYFDTCGVAFELIRGKHGEWTETVVHSFSSCDPLGIWPRAGLTIDAKGKRSISSLAEATEHIRNPLSRSTPLEISIGRCPRVGIMMMARSLSSRSIMAFG